MAISVRAVLIMINSVLVGSVQCFIKETKNNTKVTSV